MSVQVKFWLGFDRVVQATQALGNNSFLQKEKQLWLLLAMVTVYCRCLKMYRSQKRLSDDHLVKLLCLQACIPAFQAISPCLPSILFFGIALCSWYAFILTAVHKKVHVGSDPVSLEMICSRSPCAWYFSMLMTVSRVQGALGSVFLRAPEIVLNSFLGKLQFSWHKWHQSLPPHC